MHKLEAMFKLEALFKFDNFCIINKIKYVLTGTMALDMLGIPSNPGDIDIKVYYLKDEQRAKLKELQFLSNLENENYEGKCYSFKIDEIKVNAIVDNSEYDDKSIIQILKNEHTINVQPVFSALKSKMDLRREKDKTYMLNLIANLAQL